jgi:hypothetical protein
VELDDPPEPRTDRGERTHQVRRQGGFYMAGARPGTHLLAIDTVKATGKPDLLVWSRDRVELLKHGAEPIKTAGLADHKRRGEHCGVGDYDNDGLQDLCVVTSKSVELYHNNKGNFAKVAELASNQRDYQSGLAGFRS